jgi:hypothetical protein
LAGRSWPLCGQGFEGGYQLEPAGEGHGSAAAVADVAFDVALARVELELEL